MAKITYGFFDNGTTVEVEDDPLAAATDYAGDLAQSPRAVRETVPVRVGWWTRFCRRCWG
jgi:hypothetical protein